MQTLSVQEVEYCLSVFNSQTIVILQSCEFDAIVSLLCLYLKVSKLIIIRIFLNLYNLHFS